MKNIAMLINPNFILPLTVTLKSLFDTEPEARFRVFVLHAALNEEQQARIIDFGQSEGQDIQLIQADDACFAGAPLLRDKFVREAYFKLLLPRVIPQDIDKLLYLDADMIIAKPITPLFDLDLGDHYFACAPDYFVNRDQLNYVRGLGIGEDQKYVNTGLILFNLPVFRQHYDLDEILAYIEANSADFLYHDQEVLNGLYHDHILLLPEKYNYMTHYRGIKDFLGYLLFREKGEQPIHVFHYAGWKPWEMDFIGKAYDRFWTVLRRTTYQDQYQVHHNERRRTAVRRYATKTVHYLLSKGRRRFRGLGKTARKTRRGVLSTIEKQLVYAARNISMTLLYSLYKKDYGLNREANRSEKIIVSMTTIPSRIHKAVYVLEILMNQTVKPDEILLYLGREQFGAAELPKIYDTYRARGLEIELVPDLMPHTKYFYAMQSHPDDVIITVDDDMLYSRRLIEELMAMHVKFPKAVCCMRGHRAKIDKQGLLLPYNQWDWDSKYSAEPSMANFATGVGGVLYPLHCMGEEVFNEEAIRATSLRADDVWLKAMQVLSGTRVVISSRKRFLTMIIGSQKQALSQGNVTDSNNDDMIKKVFTRYGIKPEDLLK